MLQTVSFSCLLKPLYRRVQRTPALERTLLNYLDSATGAADFDKTVVRGHPVEKSTVTANNATIATNCFIQCIPLFGSSSPAHDAGESIQ